jgi:hypothetical protein
MPKKRKTRKPVRRQSDLSAAIGAMDGLRVAGGCDWCDAYQVVAANEHGLNIHAIHIVHDNWCPFYLGLPVALERCLIRSAVPGGEGAGMDRRTWLIRPESVQFELRGVGLRSQRDEAFEDTHRQWR